MEEYHSSKKDIKIELEFENGNEKKEKVEDEPMKEKKERDEEKAPEKEREESPPIVATRRAKKRTKTWAILMQWRNILSLIDGSGARIA